MGHEELTSWDVGVSVLATVNRVLCGYCCLGVVNWLHIL